MNTVKLVQKKSTGFTLIEALLASLLIGLAIAALVTSSGAFTVYNAAGVDLSTAEFLIEEIRELTTPVAFNNQFDNLAPYNNQTYNPPVDADGNAMPEFAAYTQKITVTYANPANLTQTAVVSTDFHRVTVTITKGGRTITSSSWIRAKY
jgi:type II secretory pathway pseudopilin PulG